MDDYLDKVIAIAKFKYDIEQEVLESFILEVEQCYKYGYSPIRTAAVVANHLFQHP